MKESIDLPIVGSTKHARMAQNTAIPSPVDQVPVCTSDVRKPLYKIRRAAEERCYHRLVVASESILDQMPQITEKWFGEFCAHTELIAMMSTKLESVCAEMKKEAKSFRFSAWQTNIFEEWYNNHLNHPVQKLMWQLKHLCLQYPNEKERQELAIRAHTSEKRVSTWFANKRHRSGNSATLSVSGMSSSTPSTSSSFHTTSTDGDFSVSDASPVEFETLPPAESYQEQLLSLEQELTWQSNLGWIPQESLLSHQNVETNSSYIYKYKNTHLINILG